jgi:regulation of enolase protein 1 (concanavalin A-like superfamily)
MFDRCQWLNEPDHWTLERDTLVARTDAGTDFWRKTYYGFTRDSGHWFHLPAGSEFTAQVKVQGSFDELYDQAGLMVRADETTWCKAGIEVSDGHRLIGSVLTMGQSDWAVGVLPGEPDTFWLRMTLKDQALRIQYSIDGQRWPLLRLAPFLHHGQIAVGPYCCTPEREGLEVSFSHFTVTSALEKPLHDLS